MKIISDAGPDPTFHLDADPDPTLQFYADPDSGSYFSLPKCVSGSVKLLIIIIQ